MSLKRSGQSTLCAVCALLWLAPPAIGCGPFMPSAIFSTWAHPELPLAPYTAGRLGVLQKRYARSYLAVAYRQLAGPALTADEQAAALALWHKRLTVEWSLGEESWLANWLEARKKVPAAGEAPSVNVSRSVSGDSYYFEYLNCPEDAFKNAAATLGDRLQKLGPSSPELLSWVAAQDQVFASCGEPQEPPAPLPAGADPLQQADRAYQIAAAQFYAGDFAAAEQGFAEIAKDAASPWKRLASYLRARTLIRRASVGPELLAGDEHAGLPMLDRAKQQLEAVLADPAAAELHGAARRMIGLVRLRSADPERQKELAQRLLKPETDDTYFQALWDYTTLLDHELPVDVSTEEGTQFETVAKVQRPDDLTDWILTFQSEGPGAFEHSLERWKSGRSVPWLLAALAKGDARSPELPALLEAAAKVGPASPGFATAAYHRLRLLTETGKTAEARAGLDAILASSELAASDRNRFLGLRLLLAQDLDDLLRVAQRTPAVIGYDTGPKQEAMEEDSYKYIEEEQSNDKTVVQRMRQKSVTFDADGVTALDTLPLGLLAKAAASAVLPEHLRRDLLLSAWARAVLLGQEATALELIPGLSQLWPELKTGLEAYRTAADPAARSFVAVLLMLRFPGLSTDIRGGTSRLTRVDQIDSFRDNWWCAARELPGNLPAFLDPAQQKAAQEERQKLSGAGTGPNWLVQRVLDRAAAAPEDPTVPEALSLAVRSTRYGCTDEGTGKLSKAAFTVLKKKYPATDWAKKTKHWFN